MAKMPNTRISVTRLCMKRSRNGVTTPSATKAPSTMNTLLFSARFSTKAQPFPNRPVGLIARMMAMGAKSAK